MKDRYIGITGFKGEKEVLQITQEYKDAIKDQLNAPKPGIKLMLGILSSSKRLEDFWNWSDREGKRSPSIRSIPGLIDSIVDRELVFPAIHYHTQNPQFAKELAEILSYENIWQDWRCNTVQLNMTWPLVDEMRRLYEAFDGLEFIIPITAKAIDNMAPKDIAEKAQRYDCLANYILVDGSGGKGIELEPNKIVEILGRLAEKLPETRLGVAGGLHAGNFREKMEHITAKFGKSLSVDAEGRLRTADDEQLNYLSCANYINTALAYLN